jgi:hypothetical protein
MAKNITPFEGLYCRIIPWLRRWFLVQTFEDDEAELSQDIRKIRELLDENDED